MHKDLNIFSLEDRRKIQQASNCPIDIHNGIPSLYHYSMHKIWQEHAER